MIRKVFIIDDNPISVLITQAVLEKEKFAQEIEGFQKPAEALAELLDFEKELPEVIFLDLSMPEITGWDLLDALEPYKEKVIAVCKIFILSSSIDKADVERSKEYETVIDFLHKPLEVTHVREIKAKYFRRNRG